MGYAHPNFPERIWDGLTKNPDRTKIVNDAWCNHQDWDQLREEVIALQKFVLSGGAGYGGLYEGIAASPINVGNLVNVRADGKIVLADNTDGEIAGMALTQASYSQSVEYISSGRVLLTDWTAITSTVKLNPGVDYYLSYSGFMTHIVPTTGYLVKVGKAQGLYTFDLRIVLSVKL